MFCINCGNSISKAQSYCGNCGTRIAAESVLPSAPPMAFDQSEKNGVHDKNLSIIETAKIKEFVIYKPTPSEFISKLAATVSAKSYTDVQCQIVIDAEFIYLVPLRKLGGFGFGLLAAITLSPALAEAAMITARSMQSSKDDQFNLKIGTKMHESLSNAVPRWTISESKIALAESKKVLLLSIEGDATFENKVFYSHIQMAILVADHPNFEGFKNTIIEIFNININDISKI